MLIGENENKNKYEKSIEWVGNLGEASVKESGCLQSETSSRTVCSKFSKVNDSLSLMVIWKAQGDQTHHQVYLHQGPWNFLTLNQSIGWMERQRNLLTIIQWGELMSVQNFNANQLLRYFTQIPKNEPADGGRRKAKTRGFIFWDSWSKDISVKRGKWMK